MSNMIMYGNFSGGCKACEWTNEEAVEKLLEMEARCDEIGRLRAQAAQIKRKREEVVFPQEPGSFLVMAVVVGIAALLVFTLKPLIGILIAVLGLPWTYKKYSATQEEKDEYERLKEEALNKVKELKAEEEKYRKQSNVLVDKNWFNGIPSQYCGKNSLYFLRMAITNGQAPNMEAALYQLDQKLAQEERERQMKQQIEDLQQQVAYASQKAADAEAAIDSARFWGR